MSAIQRPRSGLGGSWASDRHAPGTGAGAASAGASHAEPRGADATDAREPRGADATVGLQQRSAATAGAEGAGDPQAALELAEEHSELMEREVGTTIRKARRLSDELERLKVQGKLIASELEDV